MFKDLSERFWLAFAIGLASILLLAGLLLGSMRAALASTLMSAMTMMNVYGFSALALDFNVFTATALLVAFGMSIECTAHIIAGFEQTRGLTGERLEATLKATLVPIVLGSASASVGCAHFGLGMRVIQNTIA